MSSKLIRRIAALVVAAVIPFGAAAPSALADTSPPAPQSFTVTVDGHGVGGITYGLFRSSWS
jgi:hypothetical protein